MMAVEISDREQPALAELRALGVERAGYLKELARSCASALDADDMTTEEATEIVDALRVAIAAVDPVA